MNETKIDLNFYKNKILNEIIGEDKKSNESVNEKHDINTNENINNFVEIFSQIPLQTDYNNKDIYALINYERIDFIETENLLNNLSKSLGLNMVNNENKLKIISHIFQTKINEYFGGDWYFSLSINSYIYIVGMLYIQTIVNIDKKYYMNSKYLLFFENISGKLKALKILILSKIEQCSFNDDKYLENEVKSSFKSVYYTLDEMESVLQKILNENKNGIQAILAMPNPYQS